MQFVLMCCFDEAKWDGLPEEERRKIMSDYAALEQNLRESGHLLATTKLEPAATAATVRQRDGRRLATDGPFAETKEQLGGVHWIECRDLEDALSIAGRIPTLPAGGVVEVRPVVRTTGL